MFGSVLCVSLQFSGRSPQSEILLFAGRPGPQCEFNKVLLLLNNNLNNLLAKFHQLSLLSIRIVAVTQPVVRFFLVYRT